MKQRFSPAVSQENVRTCTKWTRAALNEDQQHPLVYNVIYRSVLSKLNHPRFILIFIQHFVLLNTEETAFSAGPSKHGQTLHVFINPPWVLMTYQQRIYCIDFIKWVHRQRDVINAETETQLTSRLTSALHTDQLADGLIKYLILISAVEVFE